MKNISLVLNIVLLIAVGVLYYFHFSGNGTSNSQSAPAAGSLSIAYINADSVLKYYEFLADNKVVLEEKTKKMDSDYRNRAQSLQNEFTSYQRNRGNLTIGQDQAVQEDLAKKQQNLQLYQQSLSQQLMEEESKLNKELYDRITAYLKDYSHKNGIQVVLKFDPTSDVLFGGESLDITKVVIDGLNEAYKNEKSGATTEAAKK